MLKKKKLTRKIPGVGGMKGFKKLPTPAPGMKKFKKLIRQIPGMKKGF